MIRSSAPAPPGRPELQRRIRFPHARNAGNAAQSRSLPPLRVADLKLAVQAAVLIPQGRRGAAGPRPPSRRTGHPPRGRTPAAARSPGRARSETLGRAVGEGDARLDLQSRLAAVATADRPRRSRVDASASADAAHAPALETTRDRANGGWHTPAYAARITSMSTASLTPR